MFKSGGEMLFLQYVPVPLHDSLNSTDGALPSVVPSVAPRKEKWPNTNQTEKLHWNLQVSEPVYIVK